MDPVKMVMVERLLNLQANLVNRKGELQAEQFRLQTKIEKLAADIATVETTIDQYNGAR